MPLILAVDRDRRQASQLVSLVRKRLQAELVQASSAAEGLEALGGRVPDLILTSSLLSPKDDGLLANHLRELGQKAAHVQTLTIPVLRSSKPGRSSKAGVMSKLRRDKVRAPATDGCDPDVFADEILLYLARATEDRQVRAARDSAGSVEAAPSEPPPQFAEFVDAQVFVEDAALAVESVEPADIWISDTQVDAIEHLTVVADEFPSAPRLDDLVIEGAPDVRSPTALVESSDAHAEVAPEYAQQLAASFENDAELAVHDAIVSAFHELGDTDRDVRDVGYPTTLEEALGVVNATLTALENAPYEVVPQVSAVDLSARSGAALPHSVEADAESGSPAPVALDLLEALFANAPHDVSDGTVKELEGDAGAALVLETPAVAAEEHEGAVPTPEAAALLATHPPLDNESWELIVEAARETSLDAVALRGPASMTSTPHARPVPSSAGQTVEIDLSGEIEAIEPERAAKQSAEAERASAADASESKEARGKKKPHRRGKGPIQDEWGVFDPDQCGFSALVEKLDEVTDSPEEQKPRTGTRVRVVSY